MNNLMIIAALLIVGAYAGAVEKAPRIAHIGPISTDVLGIIVETGHVEYGKQQPYASQDGDRIHEQDIKRRWIIRNGKAIGALVGPKENVMKTFDTVTGDTLDTVWADKASSYSIRSGHDPNYGTGLAPGSVYRKTKPIDIARTSVVTLEPLMRHYLYLKLDRPLKAGIEYTLDFKGDRLATQTFVYDPKQMRSQAVHVTHVGFRSKDPSKVAFLSCWIGSGGPMAYEPGLGFQILDHATGQRVFEGKTALAKALRDTDEDTFNKNYNGTDVFMMDFTNLDKPGTYRVYVDGVGCSYPFEISKDAWRKAFTVSARGFYHQRSGVKNGPPYSTYTRPRSFHPVDGMVVYASTATLIGTGNGIKFGGSNNFDALVAGKTDEIVQDAWGGLMDAGDWDRRIQHLGVSRSLLELALMYPDYFARVSLNIPESNNDLPDIVDEALFNLDCYRRMQTPDGGIRGGIESAEHPRYGEASWQESLTVMAYAPGVWSSYIYAGVAARAAYWFDIYQPEGAAVYRESAVRAMQWAEARVAEGDYEKQFDYTPHGINDSRNLAAAELYRLTGERKWHDIFRKTTFLDVRGATISKYGSPKAYVQNDAAFAYINTNRPDVDKSIQAICSAALIREADFYLVAQAKAGFRWIKHPFRPAIGTFSASNECSYVVRAHKITGDEKYLRAAVLTCQTHTGANPLNMCFTTGLGHDYPRHPLQVDHRISNQPAPAGITVVGPLDWSQFGGIRSPVCQVSAQYCYPDCAKWPIIENFMDTYWTNLMCEYTVHQFMAPTAYIWGYLAASSR